MEHVDGMILFRGYFGHSGVDPDGKIFWIPIVIFVAIVVMTDVVDAPAPGDSTYSGGDEFIDEDGVLVICVATSG